MVLTKFTLAELTTPVALAPTDVSKNASAVPFGVLGLGADAVALAVAWTPPEDCTISIKAYGMHLATDATVCRLCQGIHPRRAVLPLRGARANRIGHERAQEGLGQQGLLRPVPGTVPTWRRSSGSRFHGSRRMAGCAAGLAQRHRCLVQRLGRKQFWAVRLALC